MREFFRELFHALEDGQPAMLVSVLASSGSTPRGAGAMMAVFPDGHSMGTIGGGNVEFEAQRRSAELLRSGKNDRRSFRFVQGDDGGSGMVCGGDVTVHFQYLPAGDGTAVSVLRRLMELTGENAGVWLARRLQSDDVAEMRALSTADHVNPELLALMKERPVLTEDGWFSIPVARPGRVYIFGGGHVSRELVPAIARVGFRPVVYDDRPECADPALFPQAEEIIRGGFEELTGRLTVTRDDYVVIMTRGHQADYEVLSRTLRSGARYIGCIGSKKKLALCRERLLATGFSAEEYAAVHAPIGLDIGAETPAEIAVAVTAELIAVRAGKLE